MSEGFFSAVGRDVIQLHVEGDVQYVLATVGGIISNLYSIYSRQDPMVAEFFKYGIQQFVNNPSSPTWEVTDLPDGGIEVFTARPNKQN